MSVPYRQLLVGVLGLVSVQTVSAQFFYNPTGGYAARATQAAAYGRGAAAGYYGGYGYGAGYANSLYQIGAATNPYGGYLQGVAAVTNANGQYELTIQQAKMARQQARQASIDTQRKLFDEMRYEQENTPTTEDIREKEQQTMLRRARNDPPSWEISSGHALNDLLRSIQKTQGTMGLRGPDVPLDPELLSHVNVTTGSTYSNMTLFRDGKGLQWPFVLRNKTFKESRETINEQLSRVLTAKASGRDDDDALTALVEASDNLKEQVKAQVVDLGPSNYIRAMRYANELSTAVKTLTEPESSNYLSGKWSAHGKDVGEMVDALTKSGLKFASATAGSEAYYNSLYQSMRAYESGLTQLVAR